MGTPVGPGKDNPRYTGARSAGRPWVSRTQFSTAVQCDKHPKHGSGAMSIQGKSAGIKSTVDESLLCYGGPRNECVARLFVRAMKTRCVGEPTQSIDVEKRVGESDDK